MRSGLYVQNKITQHIDVFLSWQDVFLYNFFSSSSIREQWNVIYEYMQEKNLGSSFPHFTSFDRAKHKGLCHEFKQLYVAVTRAKERLWICENHSCNFDAMANYWKKLNLVQVRKFDDLLAQELVFASSKEEWKLRGFKVCYSGFDSQTSLVTFASF